MLRVPFLAILITTAPFTAIQGQFAGVDSGTAVRVVLHNPSVLPIGIVRELEGSVVRFDSDTLLLAPEPEHQPVRIPASWISRIERPSRDSGGGGSVAGAALGGILLGGAGLIGGGYAGYALEASSCGGSRGAFDFCGLGGFLLGSVIGETIGVALGTHLGNGGRGSVGLDLLTSVATAGAGIGLVAAIDAENAGPPLAVAAFLQLITTMSVELASGRSRSRDVLWSVKPLRSGRLGLGASVKF